MQILFAHGAGASSRSDWMQAWASRLSALGRVETFDYAYTREGRRRPDRQPRLEQVHREALATFRRPAGGPVVLAGKSMGGRIGCHVALEESVDALVCFGYPLIGMGKRRAIRDEVLLALRTPVLFVQGTKDRLCPLRELERVRAKMGARSELHVVDGGDHSLQVGVRTLARQGRTQDDVDAAVLAAISDYLGRGEGCVPPLRNRGARPQ